MNRALLNLCGAVATLATIVACGGNSSASSTKPFKVVLHATSDDGTPVLGARFANGTTTIGTSNEKGLASVSLRGAEGQNLSVSTVCPDQYVSPEQPTALKLTSVRRVGQTGPSTLEVDIACTRKSREVVVVVRASNAPSLPVEVGGKTLGITDENGNAHVLLRLDKDVRSLSVSLGTSDAPLLRPQNPSRVFELDSQDALLLLDQSFATDRRHIASRNVSPPRATKRIPYRVDSSKFRGY